ncbi:SPOR domain-containing protein [Glaciecola sp. MH2013]|uniref:SPOR domain-containing protein n=1 Tax=Glaciecola sp. MH2013 TaxID=2785524 RepID=UPI0018A00947|nr:SPOR domain-containing protein [Glaciecola sp. MH2013]MBF7072411.1 SPOR domain-containing protein [Glaciecola sp. MH2013]
MNNIKHKLSALSVAISTAVLMSGCSSLPFVDEAKTDSAQLSQSEQARSTQSIQTEIDDFKTMKPSLSRLVALEADLSFLLEEMSRFNEQNPIMYDTAAATTPQQVPQAQSTIVFTENGRQEIAAEKLVDGWADTQSGIGGKWQTKSPDLKTEMDTLGLTQRTRPTNKVAVNTQTASRQGVSQSKFSGNSQVEVAAVAPIMQVNSAPGPSIAASRPSQLRQPDRVAITNNIAERSPKAVTLSKFSTMTSPDQIVGDVNNCSEWKVDATRTYSLHLASFTTRAAAENGWNELEKKYADTWCDTPATLAKVVVKGREYLSLRVGAYASRDKVLALCSLIKQRGDYCAVSTATGERIQ